MACEQSGQSKHYDAYARGNLMSTTYQLIQSGLQ